MKNTLHLVLAAAVVVISLAGISYSPSASAASTCTAKCADEEAACLKRTGNKGQCGDKAKQCTGKCK